MIRRGCTSRLGFRRVVNFNTLVQLTTCKLLNKILPYAVVKLCRPNTKKNNLSTVLDYNAGAKEISDLTQY